MRIKKGTLVLEIDDAGEECKFLEEADTDAGRAIIEALETVCGSPAIEEGQTVTISMYRTTEDIDLVEE